MSIELTIAEQALLNRIGATLSPPVLSELPETDASKAGELFYLNGTLWTYSKAGQFGTLAEGEPWPVKGYLEFIVNIQASDTGIDFQRILKSEIPAQTSFISDGNINLLLSSNTVLSRFSGKIQAVDGGLIPIKASFPSDAQTTVANAIEFHYETSQEQAYFINIEVRLYPPTT